MQEADRHTYEVEVTIRHRVRVVVDPAKFTPEFQAEYEATIGPEEQTIPEHVERLAWMFAAERMSVDSQGGKIVLFAEGYGSLQDMGIEVEEAEPEDVETEITRRPATMSHS